MSIEEQATIQDLQNSLMRYQEQAHLWMKTSESLSSDLFLARLSIGRYKKIISQMHEIALKTNNTEIIKYYKQVSRNE